MAYIVKMCDSEQGFDLNADLQRRVGYIESFSIEGIKDLEAKIEVEDPEDAAKKIKVFAVLNSCEWQVGPKNAITFQGQVNRTSKKALLMAVLKDLVKVETKFKFTIYEYDSSNNAYYKCFHGNDKELKGRIQKEPGSENLILGISDDKNEQVPSPENYAFSVTLDPESEEQDLHLAVSTKDKWTSQWGITDGVS